MLSASLTAAGVSTIALPDGVRITRRGEVATYLNFNQAPVSLPDGTALSPVSFELRGA
jgi:hypothetical protein